MQVFAHREEHAAVEAVEIDAGATVGQLVDRLGRSGGDSGRVLWLEDGEEPLDEAAILAAAGVHEGARVHLGQRKKVEVAVRFGGETKTRDFRPAATVQRVFTWAAGPSGFNLPAIERAKHTVAVCGADTEADRYAHIGSLAEHGRLCLDLAPKTRYQG